MDKIDLTNCDREPIHIPGAILPHGALLVCDPTTLEVLQAAGDTITLLGQPISRLLGQSLASSLTAAQTALLQTLSADAELVRPRHLLDPVLRVVAEQPADASVHRSDAFLVIEWDLAEITDIHTPDTLSMVQTMLETIESATTLDAFCDAAAHALRQVAGYDRVMVYRFQEDDSGWVIAESKQPHVSSFLDLHYPASDIPAQARALYAKSWIRLITQVDYVPAPLTPPENPRTGQPLDLSFATLRNVSPIHREYLRNMGVDASMSLSIMSGDRLWGLFACHHETPRRLPHRIRAICELFGSMFSLQLRAREQAAQLSARLTSQTALQTIIHALAPDTTYLDALAAQAQPLMSYLQATGLVLHVPGVSGEADLKGDALRVFGETPPPELIAALLPWLAEQMEAEDIFVTDRLGIIWPPARDHAAAAGLLAISVSREPRDFMLWFRPEVVSTVSWGGDPTKQIAGRNGAPLPPRQSFEVWKQTVHGQSAAWNERDMDAAADLRIALLDVALRRMHAAAREQALVREHQQRLVVELDHWMSNTLEVVQTLVGHTSRSAPAVNGYLQGLERRISAMARSHGLLTQSQGDGMALLGLLRDELEPLCRGGAGCSLNGPDLIIVPTTALPLSLAFHELASNAARHGALSATTGQVSVSWELDRQGNVRLRWAERGGPPVRPPAQRGLGATLIERVLSSQLGSKAKLKFASEGVQCDITLPASAVVRVSALSGAAAACLLSAG